MSDETLKAFQQAKAQRERQQKRTKAKAEKPKPNGDASHAEGAITGDWHDLLLRTSKHEVRDCVANVALVLRADAAFAGKLTYNLMRCRTVVAAVPWHTCKKPRDWTERDDIALAEWLQLRGAPVKPATCAQAVRNVAAERAVHPLRERLGSLEWDQASRLDFWLIDYLGVEDTTYTRAVGRKWMISAVARAFDPGCKADHALILEGAQRALKSTVAETLALETEWFTDEIAELGSKDSAQDLPGKWIIEIAELASMRRGLIERIKAFLSRRIDHYRPSYGRYSEDFPRGCVFIGSTNEGQYLQDTTGNRRFWPVKVGTVDLDGLKACVDQLWAEAVHMWRKGAKDKDGQWWLDEDGEKLAAVETEKRQQDDPWEELVLIEATKISNGYQVTLPTSPSSTVEIPPAKVTTNGILDMWKVLKDRRDRSMTTRIGNILADAGWTKQNQRHGVPRFWYDPPAG